MLQNEQEYIRILKNRLEGTLPEEDLDDLLSDYSEHFRIGKSQWADRKRNSAVRLVHRMMLRGRSGQRTW